MRMIKYFLVSTVFLVCACDRQSPQPEAVTQENVTQVSMLSYEEQEAGTDLYPVRVLVSPDFLRLDDGYAESDYVLLDRQEKTIFSVSHEDQSVMVIENEPNDANLPADLKLTVIRNMDRKAPEIAGNQPEHLQYFANGEICFQSVSVSGVMESAVTAMVEYAKLLADRQLNNMQLVPLNMQTPCFLSRYAYAPARQLQYGLPLQEWDSSGYTRSLVDFSDAEVMPLTLFKLPEGYQRFSPGG